MSLGILENLKKAEQQGIIQPLNWHSSKLLPYERIKDVIVYKNENIILDCKGYYQVTDFGRVWSIKGQQWLKPFPNLEGRLSVKLRINGHTYCYNIHRLVLSAFDRARKTYEECRHLDGNCKNNHLRNLKWGTSKENQADRILHGISNRGSRHGMSKLSEENINEIKSLYFNNKWPQSRIAIKFNINPCHVSRIINNRRRQYG